MKDLYEPLFRRVLYPAYESGLRRRDTLRYLREYESQQWRSADELAALQWRKLKALIAHCWEQVPLYREWWGEAGLGSPDEIRSREDYARLPVLTKPLIRARAEAMIAPAFRDHLYFKATGGSTGEPLRFGYTRESYERRIAVMFRGYAWAGAHLGQRTTYLWGAPVAAPAGFALFKDRLYHAAFNRSMLNAFDMNEQRMAEYAAAINRFKPETIIAYVGPLVELAQWIERNGYGIHHPQRLLGAAESLHPHQRDVLRRVFGAPAFDTYGCREFMLVASECEAHDGLHLNIDHLHVEFGPLPGADANGPSELIITDLHNYGMPLMRYANGDLGTPGAAACSCGRTLPKLAKVDGRKLDALRLRDGRLVPGEYIVYVFLPVTGVKQYQVVQREHDVLLVRLVPDTNYDPSVHAVIVDGIRKVAGDDVAIEFETVDAIALTASGKRRVTVCELPA
ncbi:MAG: phenylacetate--CoA ligase family protein [Lysobacteraceae bacterium]|nr:MAG: phenylacetate--CoA ligase family protein [Xanthomonadaceae bacterium]